MATPHPPYLKLHVPETVKQIRRIRIEIGALIKINLSIDI